MNRFRPSGWSTLSQSHLPSVTATVTEQRSGNPPRRRTMAATVGRAAAAAFFTPAGENLLRRIGYRRLFVLAAVPITALAAMFMIVVCFVMIAAGPIAIAGKILPNAADIFGGGRSDGMTGAKLAELGSETTLSCRTQPTSPAGATDTAAPDTPAPTDNLATNPDANSTGQVITPLPVKGDGSISSEDAHILVDPVPPGVSSLMAGVWFMYRLAGLGDWDTFVTAYHSAGLHDDDQAPDAPLRQIQTLNTKGVDMEPFRLTAAALTSGGQLTGRFTDPYPGFRDLIVNELVSGCLDSGDTGAPRSTLPPAAATAVTAAPLPDAPVGQ